MESITQGEFEGKTQKLPQSRAVEKLLPFSGLKFPCVWKHTHRGMCHGVSTINRAARTGGFRVETSCRDGTYYVFRYD